MPQPIMKKYKQGEMGMEYGMPKKEKLQADLTKKYSHVELSADVGKKANDKLEPFAKAKYTQGSHNS